MPVNVNKRSINEQTVSLYIETLLVTDYSIYLDHQRYANTTNQDLVLLHMRIYFSHVFNAVIEITNQLT